MAEGGKMSRFYNQPAVFVPVEFTPHTKLFDESCDVYVNHHTIIQPNEGRHSELPVFIPSKYPATLRIAKLDQLSLTCSVDGVLFDKNKIKRGFFWKKQEMIHHALSLWIISGYFGVDDKTVNTYFTKFRLDGSEDIIEAACFPLGIEYDGHPVLLALVSKMHLEQHVIIGLRDLLNQTYKVTLNASREIASIKGFRNLLDY
ncbi:MAG: hypothetical protein WCT08_03645 [Patescibacteria group bacterium]|jgi:hypothetical protein